MTDSTQEKVIEHLVESAKSHKWIKKMILFGSRATGKATDRSDYDIAVVVDNDDNWAKWSIEMSESVPSLCGLDLVKLDRLTSDSLKAAISREGKLIYERR